jgi:NAD(P)-dependent dehydrogenase (short-subunit alcohol dehydrogenase family)
MLTSLKGRVVIITGATSGIGRAAAVLFARSEMNVVAVGTRESAGAALVAEIESEGGSAIFIPANVTDAAQVERVVQRTEAIYGGIDYAFNNAGSAIVNTSTNLVSLGLPGTGIYTASKAAVDALTRVAAMEAGPSGIRVNAVSPGNVETPMTERLFDEAAVAGIRAANPLRKIATADDVAQAALWLLSPASGHVTGQTLNIDGGLTLI